MSDEQRPREATSGWIEAGWHHLPLRVYYEDTDAAGIVYYANYLRFAERARTEMLRLIGVEQRELKAAHDAVFVVRGCAIDYRRPARLDDAIVVRSCLAGMSGARLDIEQHVLRGEELLVRLEITVVCLTTAGRPTRVPQGVRAALAPFSRVADASRSQTSP